MEKIQNLDYQVFMIWSTNDQQRQKRTKMITTQEAIKIIETNVQNWGTEKIPLEKGIGRILQEDWFADRAFPPYDRVTMDGIAIDYTSFEKGQREFEIEGIAAAGMAQMQLKSSANCLEVMTGSILPEKTNTIIRYEDLELKDGFAKMTIESIRGGQNVHQKGSDRDKGSKIVQKGVYLSPAEIGLGATIGKSEITVSRLPKVMIISTGDELVNIDETPLSHQIRRSNVYRLKTTLTTYQIETDTAHLNDNYEEIVKALSEYLKTYDVLIMSGGVSKGKFDFLPKALEELAVEKLFHRVKQRPGKPFWFGQDKAKKCTVFALPGNPISSFMCVQRYFTHWLKLSLDFPTANQPIAVLTQDVFFKPALTYFLEVKLSYGAEGKLLATPTKGNGSGDLANLVRADAFVELPSDRNDFYKGEVYPVFRYRN